MMAHANHGNGHFRAAAKPSPGLLSQKNVQAGLRLSILALALVYVYFTQRIAYLERMHKEARGEGGDGFFAMSTSKMQQSPGEGIATTVAFYLVTMCLLWNLGTFWTKRRGRRWVRMCAILFIVAGVQLNVGIGCTSSRDCTAIDASTESDGILRRLNIPSNQTMGSNVRISFRLHDPDVVSVPLKFAGVVGYRCGGDMAELPPSLSGRTVLNFTTTVSTDLKIAFIGDSISEQFAQAFDATVIGDGYERTRLALTYRNGRNKENVHNCFSVAAPVRGGGTSAFWRVATLMSRSTWSPIYMCEHKWTTWNEQQAITLVDHRYSDDGKVLDTRYFRPPESEVTPGTSDALPHSVGAFDAAILRVPHGWMKIEQITRERIVEAINLANEHLGATTIIVATLPLNNNVVTPADWEGIAKINQMIRDIARGWEQSAPGKVRHVLVQEFGNFTSQILWMNSKHIGMTNASTVDFAKKGWELPCADFFLKRVSAVTFWYPSASAVCAGPTFPTVNKDQKEVEDCERSRISRDGTHWCVESLGPRYAASIACLLGCVFNGKAHAITPEESASIRACEQRCNDQFMSVQPVAREWIGSPGALYSNSV